MKKDQAKILKKVSKINTDLLKLLSENKEFKQEIQEIRKKFKIPKDGFKENKDAEEWFQKLEKKSDKIMDNETFNLKERTLFEKKRKGEFETNTNFEKILNSFKRKNIPLIDFQETVKDIIRKYKLPNNFYDAIRLYIMYGKFNFVPSANFSIGFDARKNQIYLVPYNRLTRDEGIFAINELNRAMQNVKNRKAEVFKNFNYARAEENLKPYYNINRDIRIAKKMERRFKKYEEEPSFYLKKVKERYGQKEYEKAKKKQSVEGLQTTKKTIFKYTSEEIAEEELGNKNKAPTVRKAYERYKKRQNFV
ncbi:MAG: hypothetical protein PHI88_02885 [Candidatus Pacebacteria bacterium]|nr:hypothetical protein [Candidatus Paceibacterota bacterium]